MFCLFMLSWVLCWTADSDAKNALLGQDTFIIVPAQDARFARNKMAHCLKTRLHGKWQIGFWRS